jgi:DNA-binding winged helix-turn-helix (wHTH) protein
MQQLLDADATGTRLCGEIAGHDATGWLTSRANGSGALSRSGDDPAADDANLPPWKAADAVLEFSRFRVLLRQRQLVANGVPVKLGTRCFDLLMALLEADGSLVTKDELVSRVWPDIFVGEENLKTQVNALRKALGEDRDLIRTEFGRGYRFTGTVRSTVTGRACERSARRTHRAIRRSVRQWAGWQPPHVGWVAEFHGRPASPRKSGAINATALGASPNS